MYPGGAFPSPVFRRPKDRKPPKPTPHPLSNPAVGAHENDDAVEVASESGKRKSARSSAGRRFRFLFRAPSGLPKKHKSSSPPQSPRQEPAPTPVKVFGVPLEEAVARLPSKANPLIPQPVWDCIDRLNRQYLDEEGIYRIPGSKARVDRYRARYEAGLPVEFDTWEECGTLTSLLQAFLREIPGSVFSEEGLAKLSALRNDHQNQERVRMAKRAWEVVNDLPEVHRACTNLLLAHLHRVHEHADTNKMGADNIAICVFGTSPVLRAVVAMVEFPRQATHTMAQRASRKLSAFASPLPSLFRNISKHTPNMGRRPTRGAKKGTSRWSGGPSAEPSLESDQDLGSGRSKPQKRPAQNAVAPVVVVAPIQPQVLHVSPAATPSEAS